MNCCMCSSESVMPARATMARISSGVAGGRWLRSLRMGLFPELGMATVPVSRLLIGVSEAQRRGFLERRGGDLQRKRHAFGLAEAAGDGDCWDAADAERHGDAGGG